jgi:DNA-binding GntR family transcriptional regulator
MEWAALRITPDSVERLRVHLNLLEQASNENDFANFFQEDMVFHRTIWEAADNPFAVRALETMVGSLFASGLVGSREGQFIDLRGEWEKHRRLFEAILDSDPQQAALALLEIAAGFERHLQKY